MLPNFIGMLSTTELFVEHIISGILSLVWILLVVFSMVGLEPGWIPVIKDLWGLFAVVSTAVAYPIGIFIDTLADKFLSRRSDAIKQASGLPAGFSIIHLVHRLKDDNIRSYFTYNRFKTRVARSSFINFAMIGISGAVFIAIRGASLGMTDPLKVALILCALFSGLSLTALYLWREIANTVYAQASQLEKRYGSSH